MRQVPSRRRWLRWLTLGYGILTLLWLSREDNDVAAAALLGCGLPVLLAAFEATGRLGGRLISRRYVLAGGVALGALTGLATALSVAGLMLFKNALHSHFFLDYPPHIILGILQRAPVWTLAGALAGLGLALAWLVVKPDSDE